MMDPEYELYLIACSDMPVTEDEVRQAMDAYKQHILQQAHRCTCKSGDIPN